MLVSSGDDISWSNFIHCWLNKTQQNRMKHTIEKSNESIILYMEPLKSHQLSSIPLHYPQLLNNYYSVMHVLTPVSVLLVV